LFVDGVLDVLKISENKMRPTPTDYTLAVNQWADVNKIDQGSKKGQTKLINQVRNTWKKK
jgi:hypothetical protein